jgi:hypothetical protein
MKIITPDQIINELIEIRENATRGVEVLYQCELKMLTVELKLERAEAIAYLNSEGSIGERNAKVKLLVESEALDYAVTKAEYNRVKTKLKQLELSQMSVQTQSKLVELTYRTAGVGQH